MGKHQRTSAASRNIQRAKMADAAAETDELLEPIGREDDTADPPIRGERRVLPVERVVQGERSKTQHPLIDRQTMGRQPMRDAQSPQRRQTQAKRDQQQRI